MRGTTPSGRAASSRRGSARPGPRVGAGSGVAAEEEQGGGDADSGDDDDVAVVVDISCSL